MLRNRSACHNQITALLILACRQQYLISISDTVMNGDSFLTNCGAVLEVEYNEKNLVLSTELIMYFGQYRVCKADVSSVNPLSEQS